MLKLYQPYLYGDTVLLNGEDTQIVVGDNLKKLLKLCFAQATYFSLTRATWTISVNAKLENALQPYHCNTFDVIKWFCYTVGSDDLLHINLYRANKSSLNILLENLNNILCEGDYTLEDLCFYKEDVLFFGTVSHEYICYAYPDSPEMERELHALAKWENKSDCERMRYFLQKELAKKAKKTKQHRA